MRAVIPLCLLAGCAAEPSAAPIAQTPASCSIDKVVDLAMAPGQRWAIVPAKLNGQAVSMVIDTGAEAAMVSPDAQQALGLAPDPHHRTTVVGPTGSATSQNVLIERFQLGGEELPQPSMAVAEIPMRPAIEPMLAGLIGGQILSQYDAEFDFPGHRLILWQRPSCAPPGPAGGGAWDRVRLQRGQNSLVTLEVAIGGQGLQALLDTGAASSMLSATAAARLGVAGTVKEVVTRGADGADAVMRVRRYPDVAVGRIHSLNFAVLVGDVRVPFAEMILGMDFWRTRRLWIDYAHQVAYVREGSGSS
jgi:predicted aspartyl protease